MLIALAALAACGGEAATGPDAAPPADADTDCDPFAQTGCDPGLKCARVLDDRTANEGHIQCVVDGDVDHGDACYEPMVAGEYDDCKSGLYCYASECRALCETTGEPCADGTCAPFEYLPFDVCLPTCDPLAQDCPDTAGGSAQGCYLTSLGPACARVFGGDGVPAGGACTYVNDCEPGAGCLDTPGTCRTYCDIVECPPDPDTLAWQPCPTWCPPTDICRGITGETLYGACTPP